MIREKLLNNYVKKIRGYRLSLLGVKEMKTLILGANGYLGSKIIHTLLEKDVSLVCTKREKSNMSRIKDVLSNSKIKFIPASIDAVETVLQYNDFDWILNFVCNYGRSNGLYDSVIESNIEFPLKVLDKVVEHGTKKFLTIGTGLPDNLNMYSFSKKMFSEFGKFYAEKCDIDFYNLKLEMFYGSDEPKNRFIPNLICNMLAGNDVNVTVGIQKRDIIAIEDIVYAVIQIMEQANKGCGEGKYTAIPVGTGIAPTISELVDFIWNETGRKSIVNKGAVPMRKNEPDCIADTHVLSEIIKWEPVFWQDGIRKMILDIRQQKGDLM